MPVKNLKSGIKSRHAGLTITEVIVASALLVIALVPILKALTAVHVGTVAIERKTVSLTLAEAKLNEIRARSIYNYTNSNGTSLDGSYLCKVVDDLGDPLKKVTVSVGCDLNGNRQLEDNEVEITLASYVARRI